MTTLSPKAFFRLLKRERIKRKISTTRQDARSDVVFLNKNFVDGI